MNMHINDEIERRLIKSPAKWLVTGVAGFIGSNLLETLLTLGQSVVGLDNFSSGHRANLHDVRQRVGEEAWKRFLLVEGDIRDFDACLAGCRSVDVVLHHAALGSVPASIQDPLGANQSNVDGFLSILLAARDSGVKRFVYASSSAVYGDHPTQPNSEETVGMPLSPYAVTKYVNELYAAVSARLYGMECVGFRYFNIFGPRQDPNGAYAAVIPRWIGDLLDGKAPIINGDGETSRDFCYIRNVIQANLLAALTDDRDALNKVYNIAMSKATSLNELFQTIRSELGKYDADILLIEPIYGEFRAGDIRHSRADIEKASQGLAYAPGYDVQTGLAETIQWYVNRKKKHAL
jgi:UDP-N-acetylglucosamine 4-epimerase